MARPLKIPDDPEILAKVIDSLAWGLSCRLIGESIGVSEKTIQGWKARPDFKQKLSVAKIEILSGPLKSMSEKTPKDFIERHPETREDWAPPKAVSDVNLSGQIDINQYADLEIDRLIAIAKGSRNSGGDPEK